MGANDREYVRLAAFCETMAERADTLDKKVAWLTLATKWMTLTMPNAAELAAEQQFDALVSRRRTGQSGSDSSN